MFKQSNFELFILNFYIISIKEFNLFNRKLVYLIAVSYNNNDFINIKKLFGVNINYRYWK